MLFDASGKSSSIATLDTIQARNMPGGLSKRIKQELENRTFFCNLLIGLVFAFEPMKNAFVNSVRTIVVLPYSLDTLFCYALLFYVLLRALPTLVKSFPWEELVPFLLVIAYALMRFLLDSELMSFNYYQLILQNFLLSSLPYYALFRLCAANNKAYFSIECFSIIGIISVAILFLLSSASGAYGNTYYSQALAYTTLPFALVCATSFSSQRKVIVRIAFFVFLVVAVIVIALAGARWPLFIAVAYLPLRLIVAYKGNVFFRGILILLVLAISLIIVFNFDDTFQIVANLLADQGVGLRLIRKFDNQTLFIDTARSSIIAYSSELIEASPVFGYGLGQERVLIAQKVGDPSNPIGYYPHNLVLELMLHYGIVVGSVILTLLIYLIIKAFKSAQGNQRDLLAVLILSGMMPLIVSATYTDWPLFFAMLGFCMAIVSPKALRLSNEPTR